MKTVIMLVVLSILIAASGTEAFSVFEMFKGSHLWTGIFGVFTFFNVRALTFAVNKRRH